MVDSNSLIKHKSDLVSWTELGRIIKQRYCTDCKINKVVQLNIFSKITITELFEYRIQPIQTL